MELVDEIEGTAANFVVNPADVLAQQADGHQLHAAEQQDGKKRPSESGGGERAEQLEVEHGRDHQQGRHHQADSEHGAAQSQAQAQRFIAEAEDGVHGVLEKAEQSLLGFAGGALGAIVANHRGGKADPGAHAGKISVTFAQADDGIGGLAVK